MTDSTQILKDAIAKERENGCDTPGHTSRLAALEYADKTGHGGSCNKEAAKMLRGFGYKEGEHKCTCGYDAFIAALKEQG